MPSGSSNVTLTIFILSIASTISPFRIPLPFLSERVPINLTTAPILAIAILWAAQRLGPSEIRQGIMCVVAYPEFHFFWMDFCQSVVQTSLGLSDTLSSRGTDGIKPYNILILFVSMSYQAVTLDMTGIFDAAACWVTNKGGSAVYRIFLYFYVMFTAFSVLLGNDAVILAGTAFLVYFAKVNELEPLPWLMSEFGAANTASMVLFLGNPTNIIICQGFAVSYPAFTAYTIFPFLGCSIACLISHYFQFRNPRYMPRYLPRTAHMNVRSMLRDPIGAWVGSILFGSCRVIVALTSSLSVVDGWKIGLPFAVTKLIFDIAWDHSRQVKHILIPTSRRIHAERAEKSVPDNDIVSSRHLTIESESLQMATFGQPLPTYSPDITRSDASPLQKSGSRPGDALSLCNRMISWTDARYQVLATRFPTVSLALPRLPLSLVPFAFSQFILIEALARHGWIETFAHWVVIVSDRRMFPVIWLVGVISIMLCNISGTNIGATILLTKVVRAAALPDYSNRAAAVALAVGSNIGAVNLTYNASLAGLLWRKILLQKGVHISQGEFAFWNMLPLDLVSLVGLTIVTVETAVVYSP